MRPEEVVGLLDNINMQTLMPDEVVLVDGAPENVTATMDVINAIRNNYPFRVEYIRHGGGTAIQRNVGIDKAKGDFVALVDDDVRLDQNFLKVIIDRFFDDPESKIGGVVGYRTNEYFKQSESERWRWYSRLKLLTIFEPGRYDFKTGYPINASLQEPFSGIRPIDFMTTACAVWRHEVFDSGLRFHTFFRDYGVLEDAHFSLRAGKSWKLVQSGDAHCIELRSPRGRVDRRKIGYKSVVNYYFVFKDIAGPLTRQQKLRFWRYQAFELFRIFSSAIRRRNWGDIVELRGRIEGIFKTFTGLEKA